MKLGNALNWILVVRHVGVLLFALMFSACGGGMPDFSDERRPNIIAPTGYSDIDPTHVDAPQLVAIQQLSSTPAADEVLPQVPPDIDLDNQGQDRPQQVVKAKAPVERANAPNNTPAKSKKTKTKGQQIRAVAVPSVSGAPGRGNSELTTAMRDVLRQAGWPVRARPASDALTVRGKVKIDKGKNGKQNVVLAWELVDPSGKVLGTVRQANRVPQGSVDAGFGPNAKFAAQGAASGIFDLIKKMKQRQG